MTTTKPRWNRVLPGWYTLNNYADNFTATIVDNGIGWNVTVNEVEIGMAETLAAAKRLALVA